jgi:hypothetical protein
LTFEEAGTKIHDKPEMLPFPMKTTLSRMIVLCSAIASFNSAQATLFEYDAFDYSGTSLAGQNGGIGWSGAWFTTASSATNSVSNDGVSLAYPMTWESPLTPFSASGSRVLTGLGFTPNASTSRLLGQSVPLNVDGTVAYVSALFRKNNPNGGATNTDNILLEFSDNLGNRRWGMGIEGTGDKPWLNANASTSPSTGPAVTPGDTYFMVAKIVSSASGLDTAYLKVYGTGYDSQVTFAEPSTWDATLTESTGAILDRIRIRIDSGNLPTSPGEVDEIRIGNSWQDVVSAPEPSSLSLLGFGVAAGMFLKRRTHLISQLNRLRSRS